MVHNNVLSQPVWNFTTRANQQKYQLCFWTGDSRAKHSILQHYFILLKNVTHNFAKLCKTTNRAFGVSSMLEQSLTTDLLLPQAWTSHHGQRRWLVRVLRTAMTKQIEDNFKHRGSNTILLSTSQCQHSHEIQHCHFGRNGRKHSSTDLTRV